jgi:tetratricopeptide (TPR) repeat protein
MKIFVNTIRPTVFCRVKIILMMMLIVLLVLPSCGQKESWEELNAKVAVLYQQGRYLEASNVAEEALKVAEETFGLKHINVALSLDNLAVLYQDQGKYAEAEPLFKRAMEIEEKALPQCYDGVGEHGKVLHRELEGR